jgi:hypothetical protein
MILAVVGSRHHTDRAHVDAALDAWCARHGTPARVVSGEAAGADTCARLWAADRGIAYTGYPPDRVAHGGGAYHARNQAIVDAATHMVAFVAADSRGTLDSLRRAAAKGIPAERIEV